MLRSNPAMGLKERVLSTHCEQIKTLAATRKAASIALIGSVARGDDDEDSDYDFLVGFVDGASLFDLAGLQLDLEELLGRSADVVSRGALTARDRGMLKDAIPL
ncbi:MAG: nucleotidyltransferase domain-containing protein [Acidimicrobiaceae bacterium]|nr:nucleotidyltransferase domain-containing protein [Acidimicrobiaceae bacterium]